MRRAPRGDWKGMKTSKYKFAMWPVVCLPLFVSACSHKTTSSEAGDIPVRRAFSLDKAGSTLTVDFWLREGDADLSRRFMVAVEHPHVLREVTGLIDKTRPAIRVEVFRIDGEIQTAIDVFEPMSINGSCDEITARLSMPTQVRPELKLSPFVGDTIREGSVAGAFCGDRYGHYVARVETLFDVDWLKAVPTEIVIGQMYNTGK